jgi:hypothetical protein
MRDPTEPTFMGWAVTFSGGMATFGFAIVFAIWEVMEFGVDNPGVLALTMLFTVGPIIIVGLGASIALGKLAGG